MTKSFEQVLREHEDEINNNDYEKTILDLYKDCGAKGVSKFKDCLSKIGVDMKTYEDAVYKIIKGVLGVEA